MQDKKGTQSLDSADLQAFAKMANTLRVLSADMVQRANSGHPGAALGLADIVAVLSAHLRHNPKNPAWLNRDRLVFSGGHASALLYSFLHLSGYDLSLDDLRNFRQLHSKTPGHPEISTPGVEIATGPLGQGVANAVGFAMAAKKAALLLGENLINHQIYCLCGDGDLQEGISYEACSLAGLHELRNLVLIYDSNRISIEGDTALAFNEDIKKRFEAQNFAVCEIDGHDYNAINSALNGAKTAAKPTLIIAHTTIAKGAGRLEGSHHSHGALPSEAEALALIAKSYELGCDFFDTAEGYGSGHNETLLGKAVRGFRGSVKLAAKFRFYDDELAKISPKNTLEFIEKHLDASLKRLKSERVELYYWHRVQPKADITEVARAMGELIKKGKIAAWGLSQCSAEQLAAANAVTSVSAVQSEYSIMERMFERDVIPLCERLGVGFVAFSPLASGFLSGKYTAQTQYSGDDVRRVITRFDSENVKANQALLDLLKGYAEAKNASLAQISLAFLLAKKPFIVPIPGSRKFERIEENQRAAFVRLSATELAQIEKALQGVKIHGNRTDKDIAKLKGILEKEKGDKK